MDSATYIARLERLAERQLERMAYSVQDVADVLGVSTDKVYELVRAHQIPHKRVGRRIVIPIQLFEDWLNTPEDWRSADVTFLTAN